MATTERGSVFPNNQSSRETRTLRHDGWLISHIATALKNGDSQTSGVSSTAFVLVVAFNHRSGAAILNEAAKLRVKLSRLVLSSASL